MNALNLIHQGWRGRNAGCDRSTVSVWKYTPGGKRGQMAKPVYVSQCRMNHAQKSELKTILLG
ncbi:hypothetical protein AB1K70_27070 [Bremerella sp. JC770]|uniref:hypothetical protein n=1 Tax=Bremerella sp. JC770 TaxID=3232137 RepID=UPI00345B3B59